MKAQHKGITASLVIHVMILSMFLMIPAVRVIPELQSIQIRFEQPSGAAEYRGTEPAGAAKSQGKPRQVPVHQKKTIKSLPAPSDRAWQESRVVAEHPSVPLKALMSDENPGRVFNPDRGIESVAARGNGTAIHKAGMSSVAKGEQQAIGGTNFGASDAPRFMHRALPVYPMMARRLGREGKVVLKLLIDAQGRLQNIEVIEGGGFGFAEAAIEAVKRSTYHPALRNGERVASRALLPIRFKLQ
jgi:TonB family protein